MNCERCGHELTDPARECPHCDARAATSPVMRVVQEIRENYGEAVGIRAGVINGDVLVHEVRVQVVALSAAGRDALLLPPGTERPPYPGLRPFTVEDRHVFFGRAARTLELSRAVMRRPLVVLHGPAGAGKSSLLAAGVTPALAHLGALVVQLSDYADLDATLDGALAGLRAQLGRELPRGLALPDLAAAVAEATGGTVVLAFDQLERAMALPERERGRIIDDLAACLRLPDGRVRLILSIRSETDAFSRLLAAGERLPGLTESMLRLAPLSHDEAREAIVMPPRLSGGPVQFLEEDARLLLDQLDPPPERDGAIEPATLQILCSELYRRALDRQARREEAIIRAAWFQGEGGVEVIVGAHLNRVLLETFGDAREQAERLLCAVVARRPDPWSPLDDGLAGEIGDLDGLLEGLVAAGILVRREGSDTREPRYTLAGPVVARAVEQIAGQESLERVRAARVLGSVWWLWETQGTLARRGQLRYLARHTATLRPHQHQLAVLLRSAVFHESDPKPWVECLRAEREAVETLEQAPTPPDDESPVHRLLELPEDVALGERRGVLAWAAAHGKRRDIRRTAALWLSVVDGFEPRLEAALGEVQPRRRQRRRRIDAYGALADARVAVRRQAGSLDPAEWLAVRVVRAWRAVRREGRAIAVMVGGAALGMGLGLGLFRALVSIGSGLWTLEISLGFLWAAILGVMLMLAVQLVLAVRPDAGWASVVVAGTAGFGLGHLWVMRANYWTYDLGDLAWTTGLGVLLGAALAAVAHSACAARSPLAWLAWLALGGGWFALLQALLVFSDETIGPARWHAAFPIVRNASFYIIERDRLLPGWARLEPSDFDALAVLDAAIVGVCLAAGLRLGTIIARALLERWETLEQLAGD